MADTRTEENMKTLIKEIFQEEFKKQAENITNLISGNFKLTMQEINGLKNEVNNLRKNLEFAQNNLEEKVDNVEKRIEKLNSDIQEIYEYQIDPKYAQDKLTELEDRSRGNNIMIDGIKETKRETWNDWEECGPDVNFYQNNVSNAEANYFLITEVKSSFAIFDPNAFSVLHLNIKIMKKNFENFKEFLKNVSVSFSPIRLSF